jgi:hypothetical protein
MIENIICFVLIIHDLETPFDENKTNKTNKIDIRDASEALSGI